MRKLLLLALIPACVIDTQSYYGPDAGGDDVVVDMATSTDVTLTVTLAGNSTGTVTGEGIDCGTDCTVTVQAGTTITLTAAPDANTGFTGWSGGDCTGTDPCMVTLDADTEISAAFDLVKHNVTVTPGGNGGGDVTSDPDGIDCGADCAGLFDHGGEVTLTAAPSSDSTFVGWTGGGCSGTDACVVTVDADVDVQASFALDNSIIVTLDGNGDGLVTSDIGGIDCGDVCSMAYSPGQTVVLTAQVIGDSTFDGWSGGGCSGTGTCTVVTDDAVLVTAKFVLNQHTLDVTVGGTGSGSVTSLPGGIACPGDCDEPYDSGTVVELTATPIEGKFAGWSLPCSGTSTCSLTMSQDRNVTATFTLITVGSVTSPQGNGIFTTDATIPIELTFSESVVVTGTPTLALNTGGVATYGSGSFTNKLTFNYVVAAGHATGDLDYAATDALALNGGTIKDALGNNATLTLPSPGGPNSLGAAKALVIDAVLPTLSAIGGPPTFEDSTGATLTWTLSEVHPGTTSCSWTTGSGTISTCTASGATLTGLGQGLHVISVIHTDTAGNVSAPQTHSWTVDTVDPVVSSITGVSTYETSTSATLAYSVTETNTGTTACTLTAGTGTLASCTTTGASFTALNQGLHTLQVIHTDAAGNASAAKTISWTVDTVDPTISAITGPPMFDNSLSTAMTYSVTEANPGSPSCSLTLGAGTIATCTSTGATLNSLGQGAHTFRVIYTDAAGRVSSEKLHSWTVDTVLPVVSAISGPPTVDGSTSASFTYSTTETNAGSTSCTLTTGNGTVSTCTTTGASFTGLDQGAHTLRVIHTDAAGNASAGKTIDWTVDTVYPTVSAISGPPQYNSSLSATLTYTVTEANKSSTSCFLTAGTGTIDTCTATGATLSGLNQGDHTVQVTHTDAAGHTSGAQFFSWRVDTIAPVVSTISGPASPSMSTSASLSYTVADTNLGTTSCIHSAGTGNETSCTNTSATYTTLSSTSHTVSIKHTDLAGNFSTQSHVWSVCPSSTFIFNTPTTGTTFTIPAGCGSLLDVYAWGAGGGSSQGIIVGPGAGAGFAGGTVAVTGGQAFQVAVGGGGGAGQDGAAGGAGGTNGGGKGGNGGGLWLADGAGGGGGWSGVYAGGTYYVIAAGGGGGSFGGGGGGLAGLTGNNGSACGGGGGTQSAGGAGGIADGNDGATGAALQGGLGGNATDEMYRAGGGGGGGGRFGGGGAAEGCGGGGGSSYLAPAVTGGSTASGFGTTDICPSCDTRPGNDADARYVSPAGAGSKEFGQAGSNGLVVLVVR